jgi:hypothetical protein
MARTYKDSPQSKQNRDGGGGRGRKRHISVRSVRRDPPDVRRLSRTVIALALAQADAEAQAAADKQAAERAEVEPDAEEPTG